MFVPKLNLLDYIFFGATLVLSLLIGIYHGCFGNRQKTLNEYLWGNKKMKIIPVAISVAVSHFSGITLLAVPSEAYRYGSMIWWNFAGHIVMAVIAMSLFLPVFYPLKVSTVYEYLEKRFDRKVRIIALCFYIVAEVLQMPFHVYTPALTLSIASGLTLFASSSILAGVCVLYTTLGGLKTVVWTDVFQFFIIIASLLSIYFVRLNSVGGFAQMWQTSVEGQRLKLLNFGLDFTQRDNFWACVFGFGFLVTSAVAVHQTGIQKFLALPKYRDCLWTLFYDVISILIVYTFCVLIGLKIFLSYKDCDPLLSKKIQKHDQLLPLYITDVAPDLPGMSGLFIAAMCSASLSSMSSNLNALAGVAYQDILCLVLKRTPSQRTASKILKAIVFCVGILTPALVIAINQMDDILSLVTLVFGSIKSPLLGVFTLGILFPQANSKGAFCGIFSGVVLVSAISVPAKIYQLRGLIKYPTKPLSTSGCNITNFSQTINHTINNYEVPAIFRVSFYYYPMIGTLATVFFGLLISYLTGKCSDVDASLLSPVTRKILQKKLQNNQEEEYIEVAQCDVES